MPRRLTTASPSRGGWRPLRGVAARALARYAVCAATLASLGAFRPRFKQLVKKVGPEKAEQMLQTAEQGFKENYALLKKLSEM